MRCCKNVYSKINNVWNRDTTHLKEEEFSRFYIAATAGKLAEAVLSKKIELDHYREFMQQGVDSLLGPACKEVPPSCEMVRALTRAYSEIILPLSAKLHLLAPDIVRWRPGSTLPMTEPGNRIRMLLNFIIFCELFKPRMLPQGQKLSQPKVRQPEKAIRECFILGCAGGIEFYATHKCKDEGEMSTEGDVNMQGISDYHDMVSLSQSAIFEAVFVGKGLNDIGPPSKTAANCIETTSVTACLFSGELQFRRKNSASEILRSNGIGTLELLLREAETCSPPDKVGSDVHMLPYTEADQTKYKTPRLGGPHTPSDTHWSFEKDVHDVDARLWFLDKKDEDDELEEHTEAIPRPDHEAVEGIAQAPRYYTAVIRDEMSSQGRRPKKQRPSDEQHELAAIQGILNVLELIGVKGMHDCCVSLTQNPSRLLETSRHPTRVAHVCAIFFTSYQSSTPPPQTISSPSP